MAPSTLFQTPLKAHLNRPHDVILHNDRYVVADTYNNRVVIINPSNSACSILYSKRQFLPYSILALSDTEKHFLITHLGIKQNRGCVYELKHEDLHRWNGDYNDFVHPTGIAAKGGEVYVADSGGNCIHVFDMDGKFVKKLGEKDLVRPWFLAFNSENHLYVTDSTGIHVFGSDGQHKERIKIPTTGLSWHYRGIAIDEYDNIFITARSHRSRLVYTDETLTVLDKDHKPIADITRGWWTFNYLRGLCVDKKNNAVVVVDGEWHRIQLISYNVLMSSFLQDLRNRNQ